MPEPDPAPAARAELRCPVCHRPADPVMRPFCSKRCADIDLHRWMTGTYAVPSERIVDDEGSSDGASASDTREGP